MVLVEVHPFLDMWFVTATLGDSPVNHLHHVLLTMRGQGVLKENVAASAMLGGVRFLVEEWPLRVIIGIIGTLVSWIGRHLLRIVLLDVGSDFLRAGRAPHFCLIDVRAVVRPTDATVGVGLERFLFLSNYTETLQTGFIGFIERRCLNGYIGLGYNFFDTSGLQQFHITGVNVLGKTLQLG